MIIAVAEPHRTEHEMTYPNHEGDPFGDQSSHHPYGGRPHGGQSFGGPQFGGQSFGGPQFGGQPYGTGQPYGAPGPAPGNHSVWAILVTVISVVFCNLISLALGIVALIKSNKVNSLWAQGRAVEASEASRQARLMSIWSAVIIVVGWILGAVAYVLLFGVLTSLPAY